MEIELPYEHIDLQVHEAAFRVKGHAAHHGVSSGRLVYLAFASLAELEAYKAKHADEIELSSVETKFARLGVYL